jgi:exodeoxyribonuclease III
MRDRDLGWRLDYMLIDRDHLDLVVDSTIHKEYLGSDHCPIQLKLDFDRFATLKPT